MEEREIAIRVSGLKKQYRIGAIGGRTLQAELQSWWAKKRGKEDPNLRIGQDARLIGQTFMALNGVDLTVYKGEALGIIGCNGAGKSTLLKILSRITAPTVGDIDIWGRITSMLEVGTGFHGEMTGRENVYLNGAILGMTKAEIDSVMEDIIEFSEVRDFIDTPVKRYSSGMFVKLAFAVAAHLQSEIMVMDEVLAVGDMAFQQKCLDKMREAAERDGRTVLYVSHNMNTIRRLCDRCVVMAEGKIIFDGDVDSAIAVYMEHSLGENDTDMDLGSKPHTVPQIDLGIRMEHLTFPDKVTATFGAEEPLVMELTVSTTKPLQNIVFRMTLRTDSDAGLGTAWSQIMTFPEEGTHTVRLTMPLDTIAKGVFYASIGLYRRDELGRHWTLDHIQRAFRMELTGTPIWNTNAHGYVRLPEIKAEQ